MIPAFTLHEIREAEKNIIENENIPSLMLMENAGKNSSEVILKSISDIDEYEIYIVCGKGNNAGDGFTLARHFIINEISVKIVCLEEPSKLKGDALINYEILKKNSEKTVPDESAKSAQSAIEFIDFSSFKKNISKKAKVLIIDSLIGTGIKGKLDETYTHAIVFINELKIKLPKAKVISLDVPSGLMSDEQINPVISADMTITMGSVKSELLFGIGKENRGKLEVVPIGINKTLLQKYNKSLQYISELSDIKKLFPRRRKTSHKYSNGKLLVIGGSRGLSGAVAMSSLSAIKAGAGGVAVAVPKSLSPIFNRKFFEVMTVDLYETDEGTIRNDALGKIEKRMEWADTVLLGPGISTNEKTKECVFDIIQNCPKNMVIDADALNILSDDISVLRKKKFANEIILTPHLGEFSRLSGVDIKEIELNRFDIVRKFVNEFNVNLVLKAETTISCLKNGAIYINPTGNEALATAGSGDVLSGIIASLLSQTNDVYKAMVCGNYLHGLCADLYYQNVKNKQSASPRDIIKLIPDAISKILN